MAILLSDYKSAALAAERSGMAVNHACALAAACRTGLKNGVTLKFMSLGLIGSEEFLTIPEKRLFIKKQYLGENPDKWFRHSYNKRRLCNVKVLLPREIQPARDGTPLNCAGISLVCFYENKTVTEYVPEWSFHEGEAGWWNVLYRERVCEDPEAAKRRYSDNTAELREVLSLMAEYCAEGGHEEYSREFMKGVLELDCRPVQWYESDDDDDGAPEIRMPVLPEKLMRLYSAAARTPWAAARGDLFGELTAQAERRGNAAELSALTERLTEQQRLAMLYAVNES